MLVAVQEIDALDNYAPISDVIVVNLGERAAYRAKQALINSGILTKSFVDQAEVTTLHAYGTSRMVSTKLHAFEVLRTFNIRHSLYENVTVPPHMTDWSVTLESPDYKRHLQYMEDCHISGRHHQIPDLRPEME